MMSDYNYLYRVTVTGIYRAVPLRVNPRARTVKAVYKTYIDVIHFRKTDTKRLRERDNEEDEEGYVLGGRGRNKWVGVVCLSLHVTKIDMTMHIIICKLTFYFILSQKKTFTAERVEKLKQLSGTPDIYERLAKALGKIYHVTVM